MSETPANYSAKALDHFLNPRNVGEVAGADAIGEAGPSESGDSLRLSLRIVEGKIAEAKFRVFGCPATIASASMATELLTGMTLAEAERFSNRQVVAALGGLPRGKVQCSVLGEEALRGALENFKRQRPAELTGQIIHDG
jgi:NifU-like protein involved in Fe-S cluster formation